MLEKIIAKNEVFLRNVREDYLLDITNDSVGIFVAFLPAHGETSGFVFASCTGEPLELEDEGIADAWRYFIANTLIEANKNIEPRLIDFYNNDPKAKKLIERVEEVMIECNRDSLLSVDYSESVINFVCTYQELLERNRKGDIAEIFYIHINAQTHENTLISTLDMPNELPLVTSIFNVAINSLTGSDLRVCVLDHNEEEEE